MDCIVSDMMETVRSKKPLVHQITNYVTVNDCANVTICAGGSPVMSDAEEDIRDMIGLSSAVVLNIGTLNARTVDSMVLAGKTANNLNIPVVLDPVGAGATKYRTETVERILREVRVSVIKGNAGEIGILAGTGGIVKGVDSVAGAENPENTVERLAEATGTVVGMTGPVDYVSDGKKTLVLKNGDGYMGAVSGTGCMVSSMTGCYVGACGVSAESVASAISVFSIAGEIAAVDARGPGSFKTKLLDSLYNLNSSDIKNRLKTD